MIFFGYLSVALVVGVSAALLLVVAGRATGPLRLFIRCMRWGVATGAVTGAAVGAVVPLFSVLAYGAEPSQLGLALLGVPFGAIVGAIVSLVPTLVGAGVLTEVLPQRHPHPSSEGEVQGDLTEIFRTVVGLLDGAVIVAVVASGADLSSVAVALPFIVAGNLSVVLMLCRAKSSIGRLWLAAAPRA